MSNFSDPAFIDQQLAEQELARTIHHAPFAEASAAWRSADIARESGYPVALRALKAVLGDEDNMAFAIWESYWPDQNEGWIRETWDTNTVLQDDPCQRVPRILASVVLDRLRAVIASASEGVEA